MVAASPVANPRVSLDLVSSPQTLGLQQQRALVVGQLAPAVRASGKITFAANPLASATITLGGTAWTFVASGATGAQTNIGGTLALTLAALATALNASADTNIVKCTYTVVGTALFVLYKTGGTTGNSFTLAASLATVSGSTLAGGAAAPGSATAATLISDLPADVASMNALFGTGSHIAIAANAFRAVNAITALDALPLADGASAVQATAQIAFSGSATAAGKFFVSVMDEAAHIYEVDLNSGDGPAAILTALRSAIAADTNLPFTVADDGVSVMQFLAVNAGTHANDWLLSVSKMRTAPGITATITGWAGGATNPSLTTLFDPIANLRYQTIVWPSAYAIATVATFLNARKNVTNDVMDGRAFVYKNEAYSSALTDASAVNSSEVVFINNTPTSSAFYVGPHVPSAPDVIAAKFAGARARRFEDGISISDIVATNEPNDQFGGIDKASLPYFNTPILGVGQPRKGTGYSQAEQLALENGGVTVVGANRSGTAVVMGGVVTTYLRDVAGNVDSTWKYLEWRDTHGAIREYLVLNCRAHFSQYRLTNGDTVANYAMANAAMIRGYILGLCDDLMQQALIQKGQAPRKFIEDRLTVTLDLSARKVSVALTAPMTSQLGTINGSIAYAFSLS